MLQFSNRTLLNPTTVEIYFTEKTSPRYTEVNNTDMARQEFTTQVIKLVRSIPKGCVSTYGDIAWMAGSPQAARQVARILHTCSRAEELPWHRVVNRKGRISLKPFQGYEEQRVLLEDEGIEFDVTGRIDLDQYQWLT